MPRIDREWLERTPEQILPRRLGPLSPWLLRGGLTHPSELAQPGVAMLLYDNTHGTGRLARGFCIPVQWRESAEGEPPHDPALPPSVRDAATHVRRLVATDGKDAKQKAWHYRLERLHSITAYDLSGADTFLDGQSCQLPLAASLIGALLGQVLLAHHVASGEVSVRGELGPITLGAKLEGPARVLGRSDIVAWVPQGSGPAGNPPDGASVELLKNAGETLHARLGPLLAAAGARPSETASPDDWQKYVNRGTGWYLAEEDRRRIFHDHLADHIASKDAWRPLSTGGPAQPEAGTCSLLMAHNPSNLGPCSRALQLYRPKRLLLMAEPTRPANDVHKVLGDWRSLLALAPEGCGVRWVIHDPRALVSEALQGDLARELGACAGFDYCSGPGSLEIVVKSWLPARTEVRAIVELLPGFAAMAGWLHAIGARHGAEVWATETAAGFGKLVFDSSTVWQVA